DEPALHEIRAEAGGLLLGERQISGLGHVGHRIPEDLRIVEPEDVDLLEVRVEQAQLVQDLHEMTLAGRVVVRPRHPLRHVIQPGPVAKAHERESPVVLRVRLDWYRTAAEPESALRAGGRGAGDQEREKDRRAAISSAARHGSLWS